MTVDEHASFAASCADIGRMLGSMINHPDSFLIPDR
jgi:hypothetical protein